MSKSLGHDIFTGAPALRVDKEDTGSKGEAGEPSKTASPEAPEYRKQRQQSPGTQMYMIIVDEGWRTWILCTDMYEWAADGLLEVLRASGHRWPE